MPSRFTTGTVGGIYTRNLTSRIYVEEVGNWAQLVKALDSLPVSVKTSAFEAINYYGFLYEKSIKKTIKINGSNLRKPWAPLRPKYSKYKKHHGGPASSIYKWTGNLYNSIAVESDKSNFTVKVLVKPDKAGRKDGELNAAQIAMVLEHGSLVHDVIPRPLFLPVWQIMGGNAAMASYVSERVNKKVMGNLLNFR